MSITKTISDEQLEKIHEENMKYLKESGLPK